MRRTGLWTGTAFVGGLVLGLVVFQSGALAPGPILVRVLNTGTTALDARASITVAGIEAGVQSWTATRGATQADFGVHDDDVVVGLSVSASEVSGGTSRNSRSSSGDAFDGGACGSGTIVLFNVGGDARGVTLSHQSTSCA